MSGIRLIIGLGNPGPEHEHDRHNAGFWFVDAIARAYRGALVREAKFFGAVARVQIEGEQVRLLQPHTYMNRSGQAAAALAGFYRIAPDQILVAHDELDLLPGQARLKKGGGSAGHNGLKDLTARLGGPDYWRLRLGIGHPRTLQLNQQVVDFVLHRPSREHREAIDREIERAVQVLGDCVADRMPSAMQRLHTQDRQAD